MTSNQVSGGRVDVLAPVVTQSLTTDAAWPDALRKYIEARDRRIARVYPHNASACTEIFANLLARGMVTVGGRASCGGRVDATWVLFTTWNEVVRKARKFGFAITERNIPQPNAWATKAGGFWSESEYTVAAIGPQS